MHSLIHPHRSNVWLECDPREEELIDGQFRTYEGVPVYFRVSYKECETDPERMAAGILRSIENHCRDHATTGNGSCGSDVTAQTP
jgi:hypothetical protein